MFALHALDGASLPVKGESNVLPSLIFSVCPVCMTHRRGNTSKRPEGSFLLTLKKSNERCEVQSSNLSIGKPYRFLLYAL